MANTKNILIGVGITAAIAGLYFYDRYKKSPEQRKKRSAKAFDELKTAYGNTAKAYSDAIIIPFPSGKPYEIVLYNNNRFIIQGTNKKGYLKKGYWKNNGGFLKFDDGRVYDYPSLSDSLNILKSNIMDDENGVMIWGPLVIPTNL